MRSGIMTLAVLAGVAAATPDAQAKGGRDDRAGASARVVDDLLACRALTEAGARLACFDRSAAAFDDARARHEVTVIDREGARRVKRTVFGFSMPRLNLFGGKDSDEPQVTEIASTLTRVDPAGPGMFVYYLADGGVWQTTEEPTGIARKDQPVRIKAGMLGSYVATIGNGRPVRVKRIR